MEYVTLGKTGIKVCKNAFGALPIQRVSDEYAVGLLRKAYNNGITFFDTARAYTDSEQKVGKAFSQMRSRVVIAPKTAATDVRTFEEDLSRSLESLQTDYIDIYQFHNISFCPKPDVGTGLYEAMLRAKADGKIRHIGLTNHRPDVAIEAIESGLYETLQFPFCYLASPIDIKIVELCKAHNVGFIAMKGLSGGLITDSAAAYAWMSQYDNVLPIWGIQREAELNEFLSYSENPPIMDDRIKQLIDKDKRELSGSFCRACGYCMRALGGLQSTIVHECLSL